MEKLQFSDVTRLVNLTPSTRIDPEPVKGVRGQWALHTGENVAPGYTYPISILYLYADCTLESIRETAAAVDNPRQTQVVVPKSFWENGAKLKEMMRVLSQVRERMTVRAYLYNFLKDALVPYLATIHRSPQIFVRRPIEGGVRPPNAPLHLNRLIYHFHPEGGNLGVLLAEPGEGKTYEVRQLASDLSPREDPTGRLPLPIYVSSDQWEGMPADDLANIAKTISHSFTYHKTPIPWIVDNEAVFLDVVCKAGLMCILFDGFDEYIYRNRGEFSPSAIISEVQSLVAESDAKVLLTSRSSFWGNTVGDTSSKFVPYYLRPFDREHASTYFVTRFPDANDPEKQKTALEKRKVALDIYDALRRDEKRGTTNLSGRGFTLPLLCDLADRAEDGAVHFTSAESVTNKLMYALCEREHAHAQKLMLTPDQQIEAFRLFAEEVATGTATSEVLATAINYCAEMSSDDIINLVGDEARNKLGSLADHPLLERVGPAQWRFIQDLVFYTLLGDQLTYYIKNHKAGGLRTFVTKIFTQPKLRAEIASVIVDQAFSLPSVAETREHLQMIIAELLKYSGMDTAVMRELPERDLATAIASLAVNHLAVAGRPREERRDVFLSFFHNRQMNGLQFSGVIQSISFSGVHFVDCFFDGVSWVNCEFDETTLFRGCRFVNMRIEACDGLGDAQMIDEHPDPDTAMIIMAERVLANRRYSRDDLKKDIRALLKKFPVRPGGVIGILKAHNFYKGAGQNSPHRKAIIEALIDHGVIAEHERTGSQDGGVHVTPEAHHDIVVLADNGVFIGRIHDAYADLCEALDLR